MELGAVAYARTDDAQVAYTVIDGGAGAGLTIVMVSGALFPFEALSEDPGVARLLEGLCSLGRLVLFDRRGIGQSDPIVDWDRPLVDQWADDLASVVAATTDAPPVVFSWESFGVGRVFAARHPDALSRLLLFHPSDVVSSGDDLQTSIEDRVLGSVRRESPDPDPLEVFSTRRDDAFVSWLHRAGRRGASPATAERIWTTCFQQGAHTPSGIETPTLVLHRPRSALEPAAYASAVVAAIPGARIVELPGSDFYPITDDIEAVLAAVTLELTGAAHPPAPQRELAAVLFADIVGSTRRAAALGDERWRNVLDRFDTVMHDVVERVGGSVVKATGDGALCTFSSASHALRAAVALGAKVAADDLELRIGVHVGEIDRRGADVSGLGVHVAARVMDVAAGGEIVVTPTTVMSLTGSGHHFDSLGLHELRGVPNEWELFRLR